ncbi:hypothetical protein DEIPH_ctg011orf0022 [Deinococcus phoenicis]|uniref:Uncharacterized protein n=1 Tax=Deinococcus phoenicis TaxID=1476583 RepID=A0A016QT79_9DEIO|nr:hypothetical protein [Deinococcus phoenicis]EYB69057.1 hypothetical protein DEIPH_ctg011orf0022 [Deinococcus phoenicis]
MTNITDLARNFAAQTVRDASITRQMAALARSEYGADAASALEGLRDEATRRADGYQRASEYVGRVEADAAQGRPETGWAPRQDEPETEWAEEGTPDAAAQWTDERYLTAACELARDFYRLQAVAYAEALSLLLAVPAAL